MESGNKEKDCGWNKEKKNYVTDSHRNDWSYPNRKYQKKMLDGMMKWKRLWMENNECKIMIAARKWR